jgi:hypothetical protein
MHSNCVPVTVKQPSLLDKVVEFPTLLDQDRRGIELRNAALIQDDDAVRVNDRVDTVRDRDNRAVLEDATTQGALKQSIRFDIDGRLVLLVFFKAQKSVSNATHRCFV